MVYYYTCCGLHFTSEIELPGFDEADESDAVDVSILRGDTPEGLPHAAYSRENYDADQGVVLLKTENEARFLVRDGREVIFSHTAGMSAATVASYLSGSVLAALLHQRGVLPLHAGSILVDNRVAAFAGSSGAGKSTLIGALELRGYPVLAEDVSATSLPEESGEAKVAPGVRRLKLNSDSASALGLDTSQATVAENTGKHLWIADQRTGGGAASLTRLYVLDPRLDWRSQPQALTGLERLEALRLYTHRWGMAVAMGYGDANMKMRVNLAERISVYRLGRPTRWGALSRWLDRVEEHLRKPDHLE